MHRCTHRTLSYCACGAHLVCPSAVSIGVPILVCPSAVSIAGLRAGVFAASHPKLQSPRIPKVRDPGSLLSFCSESSVVLQSSVCLLLLPSPASGPASLQLRTRSCNEPGSRKCGTRATVIIRAVFCVPPRQLGS